MQHRSNTGDQENPFWVMALREARAFDWDLIPRIALGPAAIYERRINRPDT
jgi:hypothetical protein